MLTGITDELGQRKETYSYNYYSKAVETSLPGGVEKYQVQYSGDDRVVIDPLGNQWDYSYQSILGLPRLVGMSQPCAKGCGSSAKSVVYNANGLPVEKTDFVGNVTRWTFDARGLVTRKIEAVGKPEQRTTSYQWHPLWRLPTRVEEPGRLTEREYHPTLGLATRKKVTDTATGESRTWAYQYNADGQIVSEDGPRTDVADITTYEYYADDDPAGGHKRGDLMRVTNALGQTTQYGRYDADGRNLEQTDANGLASTREYDARGRLVMAARGDDAIHLGYLANGLLGSVVQADGSQVSYQYDAAGRTLGMEDGSGFRVAYQYDLRSNLTSTEKFDAEGSLAYREEAEYDVYGRQSARVGANGQRTVMERDLLGNLVREEDPLGHARAMSYDGLNRLVGSTDALQGEVSYGYDSVGNLAEVRDPRGLATRYGHNAFGEQPNLQSPDSGITLAEYHEGRMTRQVDGRGQESLYSYDELGRVTQVGYADEVLAYGYDEGANGTGRLTHLADGSGETLMSYDLQGRVVEKRRQEAGMPDLVLGLSHGAGGRLEGMALPSGAEVSYQYGADGRVQAVSVDGQVVVSGITYHPTGAVSGWAYGDGSAHQRGYDLDAQVASVTQGGATLSYGRDAAGQVTTLDDGLGRQGWQYGYDALGRLAGAQNSASQGPLANLALGWGYDPTGNRTGEARGGNWQAYATYPASNRLLSVGAVTRQYDGAGNLIQEGSTTYTYNGRNRLSEVRKLGALVASYGYNGFGERVSKRIGAQTIHYVYGPMGELVGEYDGLGNPLAEHIWLGNLPVGVLMPGQGGVRGLYYVWPDHLGTPRVITSATGTEVWRWESAPFGDTLADEDPDGDGQRVVYGLRFPGQYFDGETGLHYNYFRDYEPTHGRYSESDPIGIRAGLNTYIYANGNPLRYLDDKGLSPSACIGAPIDAFMDCLARDQFGDPEDIVENLFPCLKCKEPQFGLCIMGSAPSASFSCGLCLASRGRLRKECDSCKLDLFGVGTCFLQNCSMKDCSEKCSEE